MRVGGAARDRLTQTLATGQQQQQQSQQQPSLPQYVLDRREKMRAFNEAAARGAHHGLETAVAKLHGSEASLKVCGDMIEGAVLSVGVQTAHRLISSLNDAREDIRDVEARWRESMTAHREESRLQAELLESLINSHNSIRERNEANEREIRRLTEEKSKKEAAADRAIQYIHSIIAERAVWQDRQGHNALDLPLCDSSFSERAVAALDALQHLRQVHLDSSLPEKEMNSGIAGSARLLAQASSAVASSTAPPSRCDVTLPAVTSLPQKALNSQVSTVGSGAAAAAKRSVLSSSSLGPTATAEGDLSFQDSLLLARIRGSANTRHSTVVPSSRLHYIPPAEEIALLRDVLAMGTGSTTLMSDIEAARADLEKRKRWLREDCTTMRSAMSNLRQEVNALRAYMQSLLSQGQPFLALKEDLLGPINRRIEHEARARAQLWIADMTTDATAAGNTRYATVNLDPIKAALSETSTNKSAMVGTDTSKVADPVTTAAVETNTVHDENASPFLRDIPAAPSLPRPSVSQDSLINFDFSNNSLQQQQQQPETKPPLTLLTMPRGDGSGEPGNQPPAAKEDSGRRNSLASGIEAAMSPSSDNFAKLGDAGTNTATPTSQNVRHLDL